MNWKGCVLVWNFTMCLFKLLECEKTAFHSFQDSDSLWACLWPFTSERDEKTAVRSEQEKMHSLGGLCFFSTWLFKEDDREKAAIHSWQEKGFCPVWILRWTFKWLLLLKEHSHFGQAKGFNPAGNLRCWLKWSNSVNLAAHRFQEKELSSSLCLRSALRSSFPQSVILLWLLSDRTADTFTFLHICWTGLSSAMFYLHLSFWFWEGFHLDGNPSLCTHACVWFRRSVLIRFAAWDRFTNINAHELPLPCNWSEVWVTFLWVWAKSTTECTSWLQHCVTVSHRFSLRPSYWPWSAAWCFWHWLHASICVRGSAWFYLDVSICVRGSTWFHLDVNICVRGSAWFCFDVNICVRGSAWFCRDVLVPSLCPRFRLVLSW